MQVKSFVYSLRLRGLYLDFKIHKSCICLWKLCWWTKTCRYHKLTL